MTPDLLNVLPNGIVTVTRDYLIRYVNPAAENFLGGSRSSLYGREIAHFVYPATRLLTLIDNAFSQRALIKEYNIMLSSPRMGSREVNLQILPLDNGNEALLVVDDRGMESKLSRHMSQRENLRSVSGMASILAHEVKNPLSGIRGAAQLLQQTVSPADRALTTLICNEVDRIRDVMEQMDVFSNPSELKTEALNIHEILQYVRLLIEKGTAYPIQFREIYDPSLPPVAGHRNLLIQLFINIIKNASEALENSEYPTIIITTSYHSGFRFKPQGSTSGLALPVAICIEDNGTGISPELHENIFDPFVTTKPDGKGLGLAIASKIVADHKGAIELDTDAHTGTRFRILLPAA